MATLKIPYAKGEFIEIDVKDPSNRTEVFNAVQEIAKENELDLQSPMLQQSLKIKAWEPSTWDTAKDVGTAALNTLGAAFQPISNVVGANIVQPLMENMAPQGTDATTFENAAAISKQYDPWYKSAIQVPLMEARAEQQRNLDTGAAARLAEITPSNTDLLANPVRDMITAFQNINEPFKKEYTTPYSAAAASSYARTGETPDLADYLISPENILPLPSMLALPGKVVRGAKLVKDAAKVGSVFDNVVAEGLGDVARAEQIATKALPKPVRTAKYILTERLATKQY
jgi:hypothetical protein